MIRHGDKESGDKPDLDEELDRLQQRLPDGVSRVVQKVRSPAVAPYRIPVGIALTAGGVVGFLPILGFWMVPLGLAVLAQDVPVMRPPLARLLAKINGKREARRRELSTAARRRCRSKCVPRTLELIGSAAAFAARSTAA